VFEFTVFKLQENACSPIVDSVFVELQSDEHERTIIDSECPLGGSRTSTYFDSASKNLPGCVLHGHEG
jgi:hypothetical protein